MWLRILCVTLQKGQETVKIKTTGLVHNFIILANCWNHDRRPMSNGSMSYGVHKVNPLHNKKFSWPCEKVKVKTTGFVPNFIILANYWNHDRRSIIDTNRCFRWTDAVLTHWLRATFICVTHVYACVCVRARRRIYASPTYICVCVRATYICVTLFFFFFCSCHGNIFIQFSTEKYLKLVLTFI